MRKEAHVIVVEVSDIFDAPREHCEAFDSGAECESRIFFGIYAYGFEDIGVHDASAEDFDPSGMFTGSASFSFAEDALHIDFDGWFCEGEEAGSESNFEVFFEESFEEGLQRSFEVCECDIFADMEPFDLVEAWAVCGVDFVASVDGAGRDDTDGRGVGEHGSDLDGRGVCPQESLSEFRVDTFDHEGVLHISCGVVFWEV